MSTPRKNFFATLGTFVDVFGSAAAVSNAVDAGRMPKAKHLRTLGIDPDAFRSIGYPIAPVVVGLILGPMAEQQLRRALAISQGDPIVLFHSPIAITLYVVAAAAVLVPLWFRLRGKGEVLGQLASDED